MTRLRAVLRMIVVNLFPPPRTRLTTGRVLPLPLFLAAYGALCLYLDWQDIILFANPKAFFLLITAPWIWWLGVAGYSGLASGRWTVSVLIRLVMLGAFVMVLAEPRAVRKSDILSVMYALDQSDSIGEDASDQAREFMVRTASERPEKDEVGLVVFGRDSAVELPPRPSLLLNEFEFNSRLKRDGTSLAKGLSLASAMLRDENQGRIVLISDGTQTEGNLNEVLDELKSRKIPVDVLPINYTYPHEVWLEKLELPKYVKIGETYEATVILSSLQAGSGRLTLRENGKMVFEERVTFEEGKNRFVLPVHLRNAGYYEYVATIEVPPERDGWPENNIAINHLYLKGKGKVLVVTDPQMDDRYVQGFVNALRESKRDVELVEALEFPTDAGPLMPYDCIVLPNVPMDAFFYEQLEAMRQAVYSQGIGFIMLGGEHSFGPGGYHRTPIEELLPVTMDVTQKKVMPKGALVIILHTCEFAEGNTWGKQITKEAIKVLGAKDEVGVIIYDWSNNVNPDRWLFQLTPAGEYDRLAVLINKAQIGDMPSFAPTMQLGYAGLAKSDAAMKHMIIISDGDPSKPPPELLNQFKAAKISVSMVAIKPHPGQDVQLMRMIAGATGGRFYFPQDPSALPKIFIKEAKTLKRSMIQNKTFVPIVEYPSQVLKGIEGMPPLHGYVLTTPKPRSITILEGPEEDDQDPLLVLWNYGLGKAAAFTSDLAANWARDWMAWPHYKAFVQQLVTEVSRVEQKNYLHARTYASGTTGIISLEDHYTRDSFLEVDAEVMGPGNRTEKVHLKQVGPKSYLAQFQLWGKGRYQIVLGATDGERQEQVLSNVIVPYSPEYLRFASSPMILEEIVRRTGGRMLLPQVTGEEIFGQEREPRLSSRPIIDWFLILLVCLLPLDVAVRRVQIDGSVIRRWLRRKKKKKGESSETLGALLKRKESVEFTQEDEKSRSSYLAGLSKRKESAKSDSPKPTAAEKKKETPREKKKPSDDDSVSTTGHLLAMKKKWKDKDSEKKE